MSIRGISPSHFPAPVSASVSSKTTLAFLLLALLRSAQGGSSLANRAIPLDLAPGVQFGKRAIGEEFTLNNDVTGDQYFSNCEGLVDGGFVAGFETKEPGPHLDTYLRLFDASGTPVDNAFKATTNSSGDNVAHCLTKLVGGGFVVALRRNDSSASLGNVFFQRYAAGGQKSGVETQVNIYPPGNKFLAANFIKAGGFVVTYSALNPSPYLNLTSRYLNPTGGTTGGLLPGGSYMPGAKGFSNGNFAICSIDSSGSTPKILVAFTTPYGQPFKTAIVDAYSNPSRCKIAETGTGSVVVWQSVGQNGTDLDVFGQRYTTLGLVNGTVFLVNTNRSGIQGCPSITDLPGGGYYAVYECMNQEGSGTYDICGQVFDVSGQKLGKERRLNADSTGIATPETVLPSVALFGNGMKVVVTWTSAATGTTGTDIRARIVDAADLNALPEVPSTTSTLMTSSATEASLMTASSPSTTEMITGSETSSATMGESATTLQETVSGASSAASSSNTAPSNLPLIVGVALAVCAAASAVFVGLFVWCRKKRRPDQAANPPPAANEMELSRIQVYQNPQNAMGLEGAKNEMDYQKFRLNNPLPGNLPYASLEMSPARPAAQYDTHLSARPSGFEMEYNIPVASAQPRVSYAIPKMGGNEDDGSYALIPAVSDYNVAASTRKTYEQPDAALD